MRDAAIDTIRTGGFEMEYLRFGRGMRALVILPGLSVESVTKRPQPVVGAYGLLTEDLTIYVLDRRKDPPRTYPVTEMAKDTAAAIRKLGLSHVNLFGASQGGMLAMVLAVRQPDLVNKMALGSTSPYVAPARYRVIEEWIQLAQSGDAAALYRAFADAIYPPHIAAKVRGFMTSYAETVTARELERFVILAEGTKGFDIRDALQDIACPVLLTGSADDRVLGPEGTEEIAKQLGEHAGFELHMYDGYGHASYDTAPDYKERLLRFFR